MSQYQLCYKYISVYSDKGKIRDKILEFTGHLHDELSTTGK